MAIEKEESKKKKTTNADILGMIQKGVSTTIFPRIMRARKTNESWDILKQEFEGDKTVKAIKLQSLRRDLKNVKMKENENLNDYFSRFMELINQMKSYGDSIDDDQIVEKVLISILVKFDPVVAVIENKKDLSTLSVQELMGALKSYEQRLVR